MLGLRLQKLERTTASNQEVCLKTHLAVAIEPLNFLSNGEMVGLCGAQVAHAKPVDTWELSEMGEAPTFNTLRDCSECISKALTEYPRAKLYVYAIAPGEETMHSGDTFNEINRTVDKFYRDDCA